MTKGKILEYIDALESKKERVLNKIHIHELCLNTFIDIDSIDLGIDQLIQVADRCNIEIKRLRKELKKMSTIVANKKKINKEEKNERIN